MLRFSLKTAAAGRQAGRPLNLVLLLDNSGSMMTQAYHRAQQIIKRHVNANENDVLIAAYSGMTGVVNKLQRMLGLRIHEKYHQRINLHPEERPIGVRYEPPKGLTPAETGTMMDERVDMRDITATLVDLAVRGILIIEEAEIDTIVDTLHRVISRWNAGD